MMFEHSLHVDDVHVGTIELFVKVLLKARALDTLGRVSMFPNRGPRDLLYRRDEVAQGDRASLACVDRES